MDLSDLYRNHGRYIHIYRIPKKNYAEYNRQLQ